MAARSIWKGKLKVGSTTVPVKLYSAVKDRTVRFHILDERSRTRVKQHMVDPVTDSETPNVEIQKGFEIEPGTFVILSEKDLQSVGPKPSREIEVMQFVPPQKISHEWYERPYYLGPDGDEKAYLALAEALKNRDRAGVARWVMRNKEYVGALRAQGDYLVLLTLRNAEEVLSAQDLPKPGGRALDKKELNMAKQLVELLEGEFNAEDFHDEYRERVMQFIERKAKGRAPKLVPVKVKRQVASLDKVLSKSIESLKKEKSAA